MPFASMTPADVQAFYTLLDEYFESRKELFAEWAAAGSSSNANTTFATQAGGRMMAALLSPPTQNANRPATPQSPGSAAAGVSPPPSHSAAPTNKYGITVPSRQDLNNPKLQSAFKFAGSTASAAGGLLNKHVLGGQNYHNSNKAAEAAPAPAAPPPKMSKPSSYRQSAAATPPPPPPVHHAAAPTPRGVGSCTAQFDYSSAEPGDLSFREGDRIDIIAKESSDWWRGSLQGREGLFPAAYVSEN